MTQDKSTPRPWKVNGIVRRHLETGHIDSFDILVGADKTTIIAKELTPANAALIVQAVNSHDALQACVEALKDVAVPTGKLDTYEGALEVIDRLQRRALKALAALAKLEKANDHS